MVAMNKIYQLYPGLKKILPKIPPLYIFPIFLVATIAIAIYLFQTNLKLNSNPTTISGTKVDLEKQLVSVRSELEMLKNQDQYRRNEQLQEEIVSLNKTYQKVLAAYEKILHTFGVTHQVCSSLTHRVNII